MLAVNALSRVMSLNLMGGCKLHTFSASATLLFLRYIARKPARDPSIDIVRLTCEQALGKRVIGQRHVIPW
jgi:hypothetical protein